ncbi:MAG: DUF3617 family protein [Proteobacteria bacterium]|nr:DUF3617 family protein [Burkholderiales bacterium]
MNRRTVFTPGAIAVVAFACGSLASDPAFAQRKGPVVQQGLWEIVVTVTDINLLGKPPGGKFPSKGFQACLTQAQADDPVSFLSEVVAPISNECKAGVIRQTGSRTTWPVQCPSVKGGGNFGGSGSFEFARTSFEGTFRQARPLSPEKSLETSMNIVGKRSGDC